MLIQDVINQIETLAPPQYAEDFDNVGLLVGNRHTPVTGILVTLDALEMVIEEALEKKCNLIISFHPIIFSGLKKLTGATYVERTVAKAIQHRIAIYAIHTALDNAFEGVNAQLCKELGIITPQILIPQQGTIKKLVTFVPTASAHSLREALFSAGGGTIGNYDQCSFNVAGTGTFRGNEKSQPVTGVPGKLQYEAEVQVSLTFPKHKERSLLQALFEHHPYEEVAYEITTLENSNQHIGMGMMGELEIAMNAHAFLTMIKQKLQVPCIRHSLLLDKPIKKVAVLAGSGAFAIAHAKNANADIFITADLKYHDFFQADNKLILADVGHYESEQFIKKLLVEFLSEKFPNFAIILSNYNTNPVNYL